MSPSDGSCRAAGKSCSGATGRGTVTSTSLRSAGRAAQQKGDVSRAEEKVEDLVVEMQKLQRELAEQIHKLEGQFDVENLALTPKEVTPRKSDIEVGEISVVWTPWQVNAQGLAKPIFVLPE